ncbi:hypothetical protein [Tanticharoenia sakaeratensis]|uniref:Uncharacterized protein n=1 Tax=Tanticharoenia sakaeratensis NBRC 103193 TaxID=1231623 RepID=A0A0D6MNL3_9PROT|nr:hypothetical protein [Tanticharoenia sakaeratensis]GAN55272.1 hypothetical protein Tasa_041_067 [Tanticharoenia sakaeratensis NBRC 103193]GBQ23410.1 hypothetical protein AA103193_2409 [Tanticharoenia sakaeratensis NBRC 103193]
MAFTVFDIENAIGAITRGQVSSPVSLDNFTLTGMEVPSVLRVGGQQRLIVHQLPGGDRLIDSAGGDPNRIEMAGTFTGQNALARAQTLQKLYQRGKPIRFIAAAVSTQAFIFDYAYDYTAKGAVIPYRLTLEMQAAAQNAQAATGKTLSSLVGTDAASAITSISDTVSDVSQTIENYAGAAQTVIGQVTPIANIVGVGSPLASVTNDLQVVSGAAQAGTDFSTLPATAAQAGAALQSAGAGLSSVLSTTGANLDSISFDGSAASLNALAQNAQIQSAAADAAGSVNRAARNLATATGSVQAAPIVSA